MQGSFKIYLHQITDHCRVKNMKYLPSRIFLVDRKLFGVNCYETK